MTKLHLNIAFAGPPNRYTETRTHARINFPCEISMRVCSTDIFYQTLLPRFSKSQYNDDHIFIFLSTYCVKSSLPSKYETIFTFYCFFFFFSQYLFSFCFLFRTSFLKSKFKFFDPTAFFHTTTNTITQLTSTK